MKLPSRQVLSRQLSASVIRESKLYIVDTEGGQRLTQFCAISSSPPEAVTQSECLNLYNLETHRSQLNQCKSPPPTVPCQTFNLFHFLCTDAPRPIARSFGNWLPFRQMLATINKYFGLSRKGSILIGHSAISADSSHITAGLLNHYQQQRLQKVGEVEHSNIVGYIDTLPLFRRLYPNLGSYKQKDLVRYFFGVAKYNAHNALDDSLMLFSLWRKFLWPIAKEDPEILSQASVSNLYCVDRFLAKTSTSKISLKDYFKELIRSKFVLKPRIRDCQSQIKLYHTHLLLNHLYPVVNKEM